MEPTNTRQPRAARAWDAWICILATAAAIYVPLGLVFDLGSTRAMRLAEVVVTVAFATDAVLRLRRAQRSKAPARLQAPHGISDRAGLVLDVLSAVPFSLLPGPAVLSCFRLFKLWRVAQFLSELRSRYIQHLNVLRLAFFAYSMSLGSHWIACTWIAIGGVGAGTNPTSDYITSLYWCVTTLATVGYGDITPNTDLQKLFAMGVMMIGVGVYGFIIGTVATVLANFDPARANYLQRMEELSAFMSYRNLPRGLQERIGDYYRYVWQQRHDHDESALLDGLPPSLETEVALFLKRDLLENVPLFQEASEEFIRDVALRMKPVVFMPGDFVIRAGAKGRDMFFISRGRLEAVAPDGAVYGTMKEGDFFGELALIFDQPRSASVRALEYCDLYRLDRDLFERVLGHYPEVAERIKKRARERQQES